MPELRIKIDCGEQNCAKERGVFCDYCVITPIAGGGPICGFFGARLFEGEPDKWLKRCPQCLAAAQPDPERWRPAGESPATSGKYLVSIFGCTGEAWFARTKGWVDDHDEPLSGITHWRLILPPEGLNS